VCAHVPEWKKGSLLLKMITLTYRYARYLMTSLAPIAFGMSLQ
jgi:hypothetical protein